MSEDVPGLAGGWGGCRCWPAIGPGVAGQPDWLTTDRAAGAAVSTPSQDPYSLVAMAVPMYIFYEASILIGRLLKK